MATPTSDAPDRTLPPALGAGSLLAFRVGNSWMAVPVQLVAEVCDFSLPTPVPTVPPHIPGVFTLRGQVVPLLDLEVFLNLAQSPPAEDAGERERSFSRILLVAAGGMRVGLVCHQVRGVMDPRAEKLHQPEVVQGERLQELVLAEMEQEQGLVFVLDLPRLLQAARVKR
jgi:chemotaxis signal transduction protein